MESWLLAQKARIISIEAEMQSYIALNQCRLSRDETIAYGEEDFQRLSNELNYIYIEIMQNR